MKRSAATSPAALVLLLLAGTAASCLADIPRKAPITQYTSLWTNSPFTSKPPPPPPPETVNPLEDYALIGVSPVGKGHRVTLINKKEPDRRLVIFSDRPNDENMKILGVERKPGNPLGTVVRMQSGSVTGSVAFEQEFLTLKAPPPPEQQAPPGTQGRPGQPGDPNQAAGDSPRQARPRIIQPTAAPGQAQPQANQAQPNPAAQRFVPGGQGRPGSSNERSDRRGSDRGRGGR